MSPILRLLVEEQTALVDGTDGARPSGRARHAWRSPPGTASTETKMIYRHKVVSGPRIKLLGYSLSTTGSLELADGADLHAYTPQIKPWELKALRRRSDWHPS